MKVLVADKFEKSGLDGLKAAGCEVLYEPDLKDDALAEAIKTSRRRRARGAQHESHDADAGRRTARADRARRRRLQHDRRRGRLEARDLRVELPGQERDCGRRARLRAHPVARPPRARQRRRTACRQVEQEGIFQGAGPLRQDAGAARRRQHRAGDDPARRRVRPRRRALEPPVFRRAAADHRPRGQGAGDRIRGAGGPRSSWCRPPATSPSAPTSSASTSRLAATRATWSMQTCWPG